MPRTQDKTMKNKFYRSPWNEVKTTISTHIWYTIERRLQKKIDFNIKRQLLLNICNELDKSYIKK